MSNKLKLEIGKIYRTRSGQTVQIYEKILFTTHPYAATNGLNYRHDGRRGFFKDTDLDIVEVLGDVSKYGIDALVSAIDRLAA